LYLYGFNGSIHWKGLLINKLFIIKFSIMGIFYKFILRKNLRDPQAKALVYAIAKSRSKSDFDKLADLISKRTSLSRPDVYAVIIAMVEVIIDELKEGNMVQMGKLGSFAINIKSEGAESEEKFTPTLIKGAKLVYRAGNELKAMLKTLKFERE